MPYTDFLKEHGLIAYEFTDFTGGLNTKSSLTIGEQDSPFRLRRNQLTKLVNWELTESGGLKKRMGYTKFLTTGLGASVEIHTIYELTQRNGQRYLLVGAGNTLYVHNPTTKALDPIYVAQSTNRWVFTTMSDLAVGVNGHDVPVKFDGLLATALASVALTGRVDKTATSSVLGGRADQNGVAPRYSVEIFVGDRVIVPGTRTEIKTVTAVDRSQIPENALVFRSPTAAGESGSNWDNEANALAQDFSYATKLASGTEELIVSAFGYSIPTGAVIEGIVVDVFGVQVGSGEPIIEVGMTKDAAALVGNRKELTLPAISDAKGYRTLGEHADMWGTTWTPAEINASGFGVLLRTRDAATLIGIDHIRVAVYWSLVTVDSNFAYTSTNQEGRVYTGGGPEGAVTIRQHRNRLFAVKELSLMYSALSAPDDWTTPNDAGTLPIPLGPKSSVGTFLVPMYNRLILGLDESLGVLIGSGPTEFILAPLSGYQGGASQLGAVIVADDIHYLSNRGVHSLASAEAQGPFGDVKQSYLSAIVEPTFREFNLRNLNTMLGVNLRNKSQVFWLGATGGVPNNNRALVWDYYHGAWTVFTNFPFSSAVEARVDEQDRLLFGGYDGELYLYGTVDNDDGVAIVAEANYLTDMGDITLVKDYRWMRLNFQRNPGESFEVIQSYDLAARIGPTTSFALAAAQGTTLPFTLDLTALAEEPPSEFVTIPIPGYGTFVEIRLTHRQLNRSATFRGGIMFAEPRRTIHG